jgi:trimethylamine--corrinoid protein Co-methyltransferase
MNAGFTRNIKPLELLTEEEMDSIHRGALYVMQKTGMRIEHEGILKLFKDNGCQVDPEAKRVRFPPGLIEDCLRTCPSHFLLKARNREQDLMIGGNSVYFMQGMGMRYVDLDSWETRPATAQEHKEAMIVADALPNIHLAEGYEIYTDRLGVPPIMAMLENLASGMRYSSKTQVAGNIQDCELFTIKMAKAVGTGLFPEIDSACPLTIYGAAIEATYRYLEEDIPIAPSVSTTMGSEGPATFAGTALMFTAMMMGWAVITQLIKPGAPFAFCHGMSPMDMRRGGPILGQVGDAFGNVIMNQLLRKYQIPSWPTGGWASNSKKIDYQTGYEKSMATLVSAMSGGHIHLFQGGSSIELLYNPVLSIMDDDVAGWIGRYIEGVCVNDETLAIDLINQVGPIPGHYLSTAHTREWWQKEQYLPAVADLEAYPVWVKSGKRDTIDLAKEKMEQILEDHKPIPLSPSEEQAIEEILVEAREYYRGRGIINDEEWAEYVRTLETDRL